MPKSRQLGAEIMLIQMPRSPNGWQAPRKEEESNSFESGLRRDLAGAPIVSYDPAVGGWAKRAIDLALTLLTAPIWLLLIVICAAWARVRGVEDVFLAEDFVGYGGRTFGRYLMQLAPRSAIIAAFPKAAAPEIERPPSPERGTWLALMQSLPGLFNVLRGEMSLVGPAPLTASEVESLKSAKRQYLSARPGLVGLDLLGEMNCDTLNLYKAYAFSWSVLLDAAALWNAARQLVKPNAGTAATDG